MPRFRENGFSFIPEATTIPGFSKAFCTRARPPPREKRIGVGRSFRLRGLPLLRMVRTMKPTFRSLTAILALAVALSGSAQTPGKPSFESFPKLDVHAHIFADVPGLATALQAMNMEVVNICVRGNDLERLRRQEATAEQLFDKYGTTFRFASTFDLTKRFEPGWHESVNAWLSNSYARGAVMTKIWKEVGMEFKTPDGGWLMPDDPIFDPVYDFIEKSNKPLIAHLAEPLAAWLPLDPKSPHYSYYSKNPEWHFYNQPGVPQHDAILAARDHVLEKHPGLTVIGAHLGSLEHDVDVLAARLDKYPNFYVDTAARIADLTLQPKAKIYRFLVKYQDRVLYGTDSSGPPAVQSNAPPAAAAGFIKGLESNYHQDWLYFSGDGRATYKGRQVECLNLPPEVLKKIYRTNAERIILRR